MVGGEATVTVGTTKVGTVCTVAKAGDDGLDLGNGTDCCGEIVGGIEGITGLGGTWTVVPLNGLRLSVGTFGIVNPVN